jgi:hypothetical protein
MPHHVTEKNKKWATFTYTFPQIRKVTNTFSITNIKQPEFDTCEVYIETVILTFDSKKRFCVDAFSHRRRRDQLCPRRNLHHSTLPNVRGIRNYIQCVSIPQPQRSASQDENLHRMCKCVCGNEQCGRKDGDIILITTSSFRLADLISINNTSAYESLTCSITWKLFTSFKIIWQFVPSLCPMPCHT